MIVQLLVGVVVFVTAVKLLNRPRENDPAKRIARLVEPRRVHATDDAKLAGFADRFTAATEPWLARLPGWASFANRLERGGVERRPVAVAWLVAAVALFLAFVMLLAGAGLFTTALVVVLALGAAHGWLHLRIARRRRAFEERLPDVLTEIASALRAGHGFLQALQAVAADAAPPIGPELLRALTEARLGRPLEDALLSMGTRVRSKDLDFVLDAVLVQRQVGGSLAGIFELVSDSVRGRQQFAMKVRALTGMGRLSAGVLLALPILMALVLTLLNSTYMAPLFTTGLGRMLIVGSVVLLAIGTVWLQRVAAADVA